VPDHDFALKRKVAYPCDKTVEDVINLWKAQEKPIEMRPGFPQMRKNQECGKIIGAKEQFDKRVIL
jgi:hypothetical protein